MISYCLLRRFKFLLVLYRVFPAFLCVPAHTPLLICSESGGLSVPASRSGRYMHSCTLTYCCMSRRMRATVLVCFHVSQSFIPRTTHPLPTTGTPHNGQSACCASTEFASPLFSQSRQTLSCIADTLRRRSENIAASSSYLDIHDSIHTL